MSIIRSIVAATLLTATACLPVFSADFRTLCDIEDTKGMQCTVSLFGEIKSGDAEKLRRHLISDPRRRGAFRFLLLESPGGDVSEAMKIGNVVKAALLITTLVRIADLDNDKRWTRQCVSACFLVFLAGAERKIFWGKIGVHRPYFDPATYKVRSSLDIANAQLELEERVRRYARAHGASEDLVDKMMTHSSKQVYWLNDAELESLEGEQSWFQELMIAACKYDPEREHRLMRNAAGGTTYSPIDKAWLDQVYMCISRRIFDAQLSLVH